MTLIQETCKHHGCTALQCHSTKNYLGTGKTFYRPFCSKHYAENKAKNANCKTPAEYQRKKLTEFAESKGVTVKELVDARNLKLAISEGFASYKAYEDAKNLKLAIDNGFDNYTDYINSKHPYLKYRKKYCENIDGRLGFTCTSEIIISAQLHVDHIDGVHDNNNEENCQTLCSNCHIFKTYICQDHKDKKEEKFKVTHVKGGGLFTSLIVDESSETSEQDEQPTHNIFSDLLKDW
jgi:hypothetical protein